MDFYATLLRLGSDPLFRAGQFYPFDSGIRGLISYFREYKHRRVLVAIDFREGRGLEATHGELSVPASFFADLQPGEYRVRDLWTGEFDRPARLESARMVIELEASRNPGLPFFLLEIVS
jgi:hypothetical protein